MQLLWMISHLLFLLGVNFVQWKNEEIRNLLVIVKTLNGKRETYNRIEWNKKGQAAYLYNLYFFNIRLLKRRHRWAMYLTISA